MAAWLTTGDADTFFITRHGADSWAGLASEKKTALLTTAQSELEAVATTAFPTGDDITQAMKDAVCEQAFFRMLDPDVDLRGAMKAPGVAASRSTKESYRATAQGEITIAPMARGLVKSDLSSSSGVIDISR